MKVLYWNSTSPGLGGNTFADQKKQFIGKVVGAVQPDIVCLDEISATIADTSFGDSYASNYLNGSSGNYSSEAVVINPGFHLNTATWIRVGLSGYKKIDTGIPTSVWDSEKTKRDMTKVQIRFGEYRDVSIWFIHANASASGGKKAIALACKEVKKSPSIVIGDFNCPIGDVEGLAVAPDVGGHRFTQWNRNDHGSATVPNHQPPVKYDPHSIIDFAVCDGSKVTVSAVDTVGRFGDDGLLNFIRNFDHFPVAYDVK